MSSTGDEQAGRVFAWLLGLPEEPEAMELGQKLQRIKSQDALTQRVAMVVLTEYADIILDEDNEQVA